VPLTQPGHQVMFVPTPEETITEFGHRLADDGESNSSFGTTTAAGPSGNSGSRVRASDASNGLTGDCLRDTGCRHEATAGSSCSCKRYQQPLQQSAAAIR